MGRDMGVRWRGVLSNWDAIQTSPNLPEQLSLCPSKKVGLVSRGVSVPAPGGGGCTHPSPVWRVHDSRALLPSYQEKGEAAEQEQPVGRVGSI